MEANRLDKCPDCKGTGKITLLTSIVPCRRCSYESREIRFGVDCDRLLARISEIDAAVCRGRLAITTTAGGSAKQGTWALRDPAGHHLLP